MHTMRAQTAFLSTLSLPSRHHVVTTFEDGARACLRPRLFQRELEQVGLTECSVPVWQHLPTGEILNPTGGCLSVVGTDLVGADCDKSVKWRCVDSSCKPLVPDKVVLRLNASPVTKVELLQTIELPVTTPTRFEQVGLQFSKASDGELQSVLERRPRTCCSPVKGDEQHNCCYRGVLRRCPSKSSRWCNAVTGARDSHGFRPPSQGHLHKPPHELFLDVVIDSRSAHRRSAT